MYSKALTINADCRACEGMTVLKTRSEILLPHPKAQIEINGWLQQLYVDNLPKLLMESKPGVNSNPKLTVLKLEILDQIKKNPDSRVLIFVKIRDLAQALLQWMHEDQELKRLSPVVVIGIDASSENGGMTSLQQLEALRSFEFGISQVAVATSVAEEGMCVTTCSLVLRYEYVSNEAGIIQARGRVSRVKDRTYKTITSNPELASKDEENKYLEVVMEEAMQDLQMEYNNSPKTFCQQLFDLQISAISTREKEKAETESVCCTHSVFQLDCNICSSYAFSST